MIRKFLCTAVTVLTLTSAPALAADGPATPLPLPDPLWSARYTIPDTEIDVTLVNPRERALGDHMVLTPNWIGGVPGVTLDIPMKFFAIPFE
jgi:hypothetical protein